MDIFTTIRSSTWWSIAQQTPDGHFRPEEGVSLADHLEAVRRNLGFLRSQDGENQFLSELTQAIDRVGLIRANVAEVLSIVALLHDIGKPKEDKEAEISHPLSGKAVKQRHPIVGLIAGLELLPDETPHREQILALVEEHDTPYAWYMQSNKTGQTPGQKAWGRLDRKIEPIGNGTGLILLALFKIADIDGHENPDDVSWFIEQANGNYLDEKNRALPVPDRDDLAGVADEGTWN
jgi:hypothetical protein